MSARLCALAAGGVLLGAARGTVQLLQGERISIGQKILIGAVLLGTPGMMRVFSPAAPPEALQPASPPPQAAGDLQDNLSDFAFRPQGSHGALEPARFRVVEGTIVPYVLNGDGSWIPVRPAGQADPGRWPASG